jgi:hypothetical protein
MGHVSKHSANGGTEVSVNKPAPARFIGQAKELATDFTTQAKDLVSKKVTERQERSAQALTDLASLLRDKGAELDTEFIGPTLGKVAVQIDRAAEFLSEANVHDMVQSTERFARRQPWLFLGGAFISGFVAARFLKTAATAIKDELVDTDDEFEAADVAPASGRRGQSGAAKSHTKSRAKTSKGGSTGGGGKGTI